jgi:hypothetical protein
MDTGESSLFDFYNRRVDGGQHAMKYELEKGKLYQVYGARRGQWLILEFGYYAPAHVANGLSWDDHGKARRTWKEPAAYWFKGIRGGIEIVREREIDIREVPQETLDEIARLRGEIERLGREQLATVKELVRLCN